MPVRILRTLTEGTYTGIDWKNLRFWSKHKACQVSKFKHLADLAQKMLALPGMQPSNKKTDRATNLQREIWKQELWRLEHWAAMLESLRLKQEGGEKHDTKNQADNDH